MTVKHLNQTELSDRWNLSPRTLERWRWLGEGPRYLKLGGRIVYRLEDIQAFEEQQLRQVTGSAEPASPMTAVPQQASWAAEPARRIGRSVRV